MEEFNEHLNKYLSFFDSAFEVDYRDSLQIHHLTSLKVVSTFIFCLGTSIYFSNPLQIEIFRATPLIFLIIYHIAIFSIYMIVRRNHPSKSATVLMGYILFYIIGLGELIHFNNNIGTLSSGLKFILGLNVQIGYLLLIFSNIRWTKSLIIIAITQAHQSIRIFNVGEANEFQISALFTIYIPQLFIVYLSFQNEKMSKINFLRMKNLGRQLKSFEDLIYRLLPISIFVVRNENLVFFNRKSQKMFSTSSSHEIKQQVLENIKVK